MRIAIVAEVHPDTPHVSGQRAARFAAALAARGHQVVQLSQTLRPDDAGTDPRTLPASLGAHDWSLPFHIACRRRRSRIAEAVRGGRLPTLLRRPLAAFQLGTDGPSPEWSRGARAYQDALLAAFRPDVVWAIFGSISDLVSGRSLARAAGCPYVIDFKDDWDKFIAPALRGPIARRFRDASAYTSNARQYGEVAARWFAARARSVVYSGVSPELSAAGRQAEEAAGFRFTLVGSFYRRQNLQGFIAAFSAWLSTLSETDRADVELAYAGREEAAFREAAKGLACRVRAEPYLTLAELGRLCRGGAANGYLWHPGGFHHKLLELIACGRPVIAYPGELEESVLLARRFGGDLRVCADQAALADTLQALWRDRQRRSPHAAAFDPGALSWDAFAADLEQALTAAVAGARAS